MYACLPSMTWALFGVAVRGTLLAAHEGRLAGSRRTGSLWAGTRGWFRLTTLGVVVG